METKQAPKKRFGRQEEQFDTENVSVISEFMKEIAKDSVAARDRIAKKIEDNEIDMRTLSMNIYYLSFR